MKEINYTTIKKRSEYPEKILQFGEGNFLRAFVDWMVDKMNKDFDYNSGIVITQPIEHGISDHINNQNGFYHVILKGIDKGRPVKEKHLIESVTRAINPYKELNEYLNIIKSPNIRFVISNTTEAGIIYNGNDKFEDELQDSFPGKVTKLLHERFKEFNGDSSKGLIFICCELIDKNASQLKKYVLKHAEKWNLEANFINWVNNACYFCNSLVDRIVPGFPKETIKEVQEELGYSDNLVTEGEYFHLWAIEAPELVREEFPIDKCGLNVKFVEDLSIYRELKVKILNGAHTGSFAVSLLSGLETVKESITHPILGEFMKDMIINEISPTIEYDKDELNKYIDAIIERFHNPYIKHEWKSIALNAMSKWKTRNLPSMLQYIESKNDLPHNLVISLSALCVYYRGEFNNQKIELHDDLVHINYMKEVWSNFESVENSFTNVAEKFLSYKELWGINLNDIENLKNEVAENISQIITNGALNRLKKETCKI